MTGGIISDGGSMYLWLLCGMSCGMWLMWHRYQRAFVDFFEDELVRHGYDWKKVVVDYLFSGKEPLFSSLVADREWLRYCLSEDMLTLCV
jgi:hypothetical protein